jgi:hypothetical protein
MADDPSTPANPGFNEKVVLIGAVSAHFAKGNGQGLSADAGGLCQDRQEIAVSKRETAKASESPLLEQKPSHSDVNILIHVQGPARFR